MAGGHAWQVACVVGGHVWQGGSMHGKGGHTWQGGHVWQGEGACMAGGVHGGGHMWQGGIRGRGACVAGGMCGRGACVAGETATEADGTHPTGMHSCYLECSYVRFPLSSQVTLFRLFFPLFLPLHFRFRFYSPRHV